MHTETVQAVDRVEQRTLNSTRWVARSDSPPRVTPLGCWAADCRGTWGVEGDVHPKGRRALDITSVDQPEAGRSRWCCTLVVLVLIYRFTTWGRQFWHGPAISEGPESVKVWAVAGGTVAVRHRGVRISVLLSFQGNDMMAHFQVIAGAAADWAAVKAVAYTAFLGIFGHFLRLGRSARGTALGRHVHGAAVHAGVARLARPIG